MVLNDSNQLRTDALGGIKRGHGFLEYHGGIAPTHGTHFFFGGGQDIQAQQRQGPRRNLEPVRRKQEQRRHGHHRIARTRLPHHTAELRSDSRREGQGGVSQGRTRGSRDL